MSAPPATYADAVRLLFRCYARLHGKERYADKTPPYVFEIPALAAMFPEARFVHVIRDGGNVAASMVRASWHKGTLGAGRLGRGRDHRARGWRVLPDQTARAVTKSKREAVRIYRRARRAAAPMG